MVRRKSFLAKILLAAFVISLAVGCAQQPVQRYGMVIGIEKQNIPEYKKLNADVWPGVLKAMDKSNMANCSIYLGEVEKDKYYLFRYFEYTGSDFAADMAKMTQDETIQKWWMHTDPLEVPLPTRQEGEWWSKWEEVFHHNGPPVASNKEPKRVGSIIGITRENILVYTQMHAVVWPGVLAAIDRANIRNYSIYLGQIEPDHYIMFSYYEYVGDNFEEDMKGITDEVTRAWLSYTDKLQVPLEGRKEGEWWKTIEQIFHTD